MQLRATTGCAAAAVAAIVELPAEHLSSAQRPLAGAGGAAGPGRPPC